MAATEAIAAALDSHGSLIVFINFCADVMLFFFSYVVQKLFIFRK